MHIYLKPGEEVTICLCDENHVRDDGEYTFKHGANNTVTIETDWADDKGREGIIYSVDPNAFGVGVRFPQDVPDGELTDEIRAEEWIIISRIHPGTYWSQTIGWVGHLAHATVYTGVQKRYETVLPNKGDWWQMPPNALVADPFGPIEEADQVWVIQSTTHSGHYWSEQLGWCGFHGATRFTASERATWLTTPGNSEWVLLLPEGMQ